MPNSMPDSTNSSSLFNIRYVDRLTEDIETDPECSAADIHAFNQGDWSHLTRKQIAFLKACKEDPDSIEWDRRHQNVVTIPPEVFFQMLLIHFPADSIEENYEILRRIVGPHPIGYHDLLDAARRLKADPSLAH